MKERVDVIWIVAIADHLIPSAWSMLMSFLTLHSKSKTQANAQTKQSEGLSESVLLLTRASTARE